MSEETDWEEIIEIPDKGIFQVKYHQLSLKALKNKKSRLLRKMAKLEREIAQSKANIIWKNRELKHIKKHNFDVFIESETKREREAIEKANIFLQQWIGKKNFESLQKNGVFSFVGKDGRRYRIKKNGQLQLDGGKYWLNCCTMKPSLPMPDIIASTFTEARNNSFQLFGYTVKTKTEEEVKQEDAS